jgi:hypothetical protein
MIPPRDPWPWPPPKPKFTWLMNPGPGGPEIDCVPSEEGGQIVLPLMETEASTEAHDEELQRCTREINALLERAAKENTDDDRVLSCIAFRNRLLLVWARYGAIGPDAPEDEVAKAVAIRLPGKGHGN